MSKQIAEQTLKQRQETCDHEGSLKFSSKGQILCADCDRPLIWVRAEHLRIYWLEQHQPEEFEAVIAKREATKAAKATPFCKG